MIARLSAKVGERVTASDGPDLDHRAHRRGPRHNHNLPLVAFEVVLCVRVEGPEHISIEEARALLAHVRWILRSKSRFGHRLVILVDGRVVIGAATTGRSSSRCLNRVIRQLTVLCFVGGLVLHLIFHTKST